MEINKSEFMKNFHESMGKIPKLKTIDVNLFDFNSKNTNTKESVLNALKAKHITYALTTGSWYGCNFEDPKDYTDIFVTKFDRISHRIFNITVVDGLLIGTIDILDTQMGNTLLKFLQYAKFALVGLSQPTYSGPEVKHNLTISRFDFLIPK